MKIAEIYIGRKRSVFLYAAAIAVSLSLVACFGSFSAEGHECDRCLACEECLAEDEGIRCAPRSHAGKVCVDGDIRWQDSCGNDEGLAEECPPQHSHCVQAGEEATCECIDLWQGEDCLDCPENRDPSKQCTACLPGWDLATNCTECLDNFDLASECQHCKEGYSLASGCTECLPNRDITGDCIECLNNWDIVFDCEQCKHHWIDNSDDCGTCPGNWDPDEDCNACRGKWDVNDNCESCLGNWSVASGCTSCSNNWTGTDCDECPPNWDPAADCESCLGNWDEAASCAECSNNWIDEANDCGTCPGNWDPEQDCDLCFHGWQGTDCETQPQCIRYVDASNLATVENGHSWLNAFNTIQEGLDAAYNAIQGGSPSSPDRCEVWVRAGRYYIYETDDGDAVVMHENVDIYGGFSGVETALDQRDISSNETILDGSDKSATDTRVLNVVKGANNAVLDGFTITRGRANNSTNDMDPGALGGGILAINVSPTVRNCRFAGNTASYGGAIMARGSSISISQCEFEANTAGWGGAIYWDSSDVYVTGSSFAENVVTGGGGALRIVSSQGIIVESDFIDNDAESHGGGIRMVDSTVTLSGCNFSENSSFDGVGGAISIYTEVTNSGDTLIDSCYFHHNHAAGESGGAVAVYADQVSIQNSLFYSNNAERGGAISITTGAIGVIVNSTVYGNYAGFNGGGFNAFMDGYIYIMNSIVAGNSPNQFYDLYDPVYVEYSLVENGHEGDGNIDDYPYFVAIGSDDFHLESNSPCIDSAAGAGTYTFSNGASIALFSRPADIEGNPMMDSPTANNTGPGDPPYIDMGAYEFQP